MVINENDRLLLVIGIGYNTIAEYCNINLNRMVIDGKKYLLIILGYKYKADVLGDFSFVFVLSRKILGFTNCTSTLQNIS